jgi:hypothetical protein
LLCQRADGRIGGGAQLPPDQLLVIAGVLERAGTVTGGRERSHESECGAGAEGIEPGQFLPALDRQTMVAPPGGLSRRCLQGVRVPVADPGALLPCPALEFGQVRQSKPIQERALVQGDRLVDCAAGEGRPEIPEIAGEACRVELKAGGPGEYNILAEMAANSEQGLVEGVSGPSSVALRPQI